MRAFVTGYLILLLMTASAQLSQPIRWEQELKYTEDAYSIVNLRQQGLALIRDLEDYQNGKAKWEVTLLDTLFRKTWTTTLLVESEYVFLGYEYTLNTLNLMFRKSLIENLDVQIFDIDLVNKTVHEAKTDLKLQVRLSHYTVANGNCVFGGYVGLDPVLIIFEPATNRNLIVPGFFLAQSELLDVRPNSNGTFNILMGQRNQGKEKLIFRTFDKRGTILVEDVIPIDDDKTILKGACSTLQHDEVLIGGTFTLKNGRQASGLFSSLVDPFSEQPVNFTEFSQLQHFLDYLPDRKARKIREKSATRTTYGKEAGFRTNVRVHRIEEFKGGFALFGESYLESTSTSNSFAQTPYAGSASRPYSTSSNPYGYNPYGGRYTSQNRDLITSFDLRMNQGFVVAFDYKGNRLWDYSVPMSELKAYTHDQISDFAIAEDVPNFLYKNESNLMFSNHSTDTLQVSQAKEIQIKLNSEWEEAKPADNDDGLVRHWFNQNFYVWGVSNIKDKRPGSANRRVFYINKIQLD